MRTETATPSLVAPTGAIKSKVFVAHDTGNVNLFPAKRFGALAVCVEGHVNENDMDIAVADMRNTMAQAKKGDYFLPVGSPALIAVGAVEMAKRCGNLRIMVWDKNSRSYGIVEVSSL